MKKVGIVLHNSNKFFDTRKCIDSIKKQNYDNYDIFVVDTSLSDQARFEKIKAIRLIKKPQNTSYIDALNYGMRTALKNNAEYVLILKSDTYVDENMLSTLIFEAENEPKAGLISPVVYFEGTERIWYGGAKFNLFTGHFRHQRYNKKDKCNMRQKYTNFTSGAVMLIRKKLIDEIGLLDPDYIGGLEELDYGARARKAGYKTLFVPKAKMWRKVSRDSTFIIRQKMRNRVLFMKKHSGIIHWPTFYIFYISYFAGVLTYYFLRGNFSAVKAAIVGFWQATHIRSS